MARKRRGRGFARPGSTVTRKVGGRMVTFKANSSRARIPGKLVPRREKPNISSNTIPGRKRKKKRKRKAVSRKRKSTTRRKRVVKRTRRRVGRPRKRTVKRSHKRKRRSGRRRRR